jgi:hypothetical protein
VLVAPPVLPVAEPDDPVDPPEVAVPNVFVPGDVGTFADLPAPLGSLAELFGPPTLAGPLGTPLTRRCRRQLSRHLVNPQTFPFRPLARQPLPPPMYRLRTHLQLPRRQRFHHRSPRLRRQLAQRQLTDT